METDTQSFFSHLKAQLAYYKKRTALLVVLLLAWAILLGKYWTGRGDNRVQAETSPVVATHPNEVPADSPPDSPEILAYWEDLHRELLRNPFDSPRRPSIGATDQPPTPPAPGTPGTNPDGTPDPASDLTAGLVLMGTINPAGSGQAGAIINDALYRIGDVIRGSQLRLLKIIDEDRVLLGDVNSGSTMVLTTTRGDLPSKR